MRLSLLTGAQGAQKTLTGPGTGLQAEERLPLLLGAGQQPGSPVCTCLCSASSVPPRSPKSKPGPLCVVGGGPERGPAQGWASPFVLLPQAPPIPRLAHPRLAGPDRTLLSALSHALPVGCSALTVTVLHALLEPSWVTGAAVLSHLPSEGLDLGREPDPGFPCCSPGEGAVQRKPAAWQPAQGLARAHLELSCCTLTLPPGDVAVSQVGHGSFLTSPPLLPPAWPAPCPLVRAAPSEGGLGGWSVWAQGRNCCSCPPQCQQAWQSLSLASPVKSSWRSARVSVAQGVRRQGVASFWGGGTAKCQEKE